MGATHSLMKTSLHVLSAALLIAASTSAQTIDQDQPLIDSDCLTATHSLVAQSFVPAASTCAGVGVYITDNAGWSGSEVVTMNLYDVDPYSIGATPIATATDTVTQGPGFGGWFDMYWPAVPVTPGQTYWFEFADSGINSICLQGHLGFDAYPNGEFYYQGAPFFIPGWDLTFRTWADNGITLTTTGSCPGAITMNVANAGPGSPVAIAYGPAGSFTLPGGTCAGLSLGIGAPSLGAILVADAFGTTSLTASLPAGACGLTVQAVDLGTCTASGPVVL